MRHNTYICMAPGYLLRDWIEDDHKVVEANGTKEAKKIAAEFWGVDDPDDIMIIAAFMGTPLRLSIPETAQLMHCK